MSTSTTPTKKHDPKTITYENNPFFVATNGLDLLFKKAQSVGIVLAILVAVMALASLPSTFAPAPTGDSQTNTQPSEAFPSIPVEVWVIGGLIVLGLLLIITAISIVIKGFFDYTSAELARGKTVTVSDAFRGVFSHFWGYLWVQIIVAVKVLLWSLLFIIPGFIMSIRYSLAGVAYFDKALKGNASVERSLTLTKGAWLTTYASQNLLNLLTLGIIQPLLVPGTNAVLYNQLQTAGSDKPKAHIVSWLTLIIPIILGALLLAGVFFLGWALINYSNAS